MCRPLIAADVFDSRQVVDHEVNGYLCAVPDAGSLASAMAFLAGLTPDQRDALGQAARKKVQEQFSEQYVVQAYLDVISGLRPAYAVA
jgi:glycosyltransferase involved in cell wall biosynthesis